MVEEKRVKAMPIQKRPVKSKKTKKARATTRKKKVRPVEPEIIVQPAKPSEEGKKYQQTVKQIKSLIVPIVSVVFVIILIYLVLPSSRGGFSQSSSPSLKTVGTGGITTDVTPWLEWNYVSGAYYYEIQVDDDVGFNSPIINTTSYYNPYACMTLSVGTYYWRVRAVDYYGNYTSWAIGYFIIESSMVAPTLETVGTDGVTTDTTPLLGWSYVSDAYYEIQVDDNVSFDSPVINTTSYYSSYICTTLAPGTYYWRVRAVDYYGNSGTWAIGFFIIESSESSTTISANDDNYIFHHEWNYGGSRWTYGFQIPKACYEYFSNKVRTSDYSEYVDNPVDDNWISQLANRFREVAEKQEWSEFETVSFVLAFVQSLPYTSDSVTTGYDEYPRYPIETIVDGGGDCEDTSILFASLVRGMPYGTVLLYLQGDNHMAVGVSISQNVVNNWNQYYPLTHYTSNGNIYAYCETATEGYQLGQMPDEISGAAIIILV